MTPLLTCRTPLLMMSALIVGSRSVRTVCTVWNTTISRSSFRYRKRYLRMRRTRLTRHHRVARAASVPWGAFLPPGAARAPVRCRSTRHVATEADGRPRSEAVQPRRVLAEDERPLLLGEALGRLFELGDDAGDLGVGMR